MQPKPEGRDQNPAVAAAASQAPVTCASSRSNVRSSMCTGTIGHFGTRAFISASKFVQSQ